MFCCFVPQRQAVLLNHLQVQLKKARAESLLMESRVREDIGREFSELFSEMQNDYKWDPFRAVLTMIQGGILFWHLNSKSRECVCVRLSERLAREREILEERAERRLEIFKNLINKMAAGPSGEAEAVVTQTFIYVLQSPSVIVVFTSLFCACWFTFDLNINEIKRNRRLQVGNPLRRHIVLMWNTNNRYIAAG